MEAWGVGRRGGQGVRRLVERASPRRAKAAAVVAKAAAGVRVSHGAVSRNSLPSLSMLPQEGVGGGAPRPR